MKMMSNPSLANRLENIAWLTNIDKEKAEEWCGFNKKEKVYVQCITNLHRLLYNGRSSKRSC